MFQYIITIRIFNSETGRFIISNICNFLTVSSENMAANSKPRSMCGLLSQVKYTPGA